MHAKLKLAALTVAATLGLAVSTAEAAPMGAGAGRSLAGDTTVTQVDAKRCWWRNGQRRCRWVSEDGKTSSYRAPEPVFDVGSRRPEEFKTGSSEWWRAMDRQGRGGFGRN